MAKQTFSVGQVLTAAQMTSLQQTAMGGGAASAKTANYVLVAADAGTTISMTSTSATTITVNTGLFAAGDTVFIQNLGSGTCTITAGTATVNTAGSLILPQYDAGILYFVSASSAIFYDYIQVGATSPLTTKGDIYVYGSSDTRLPVGANGTTLVADSSTTTGLKWATPSGGGKVLQVVQGTTTTTMTTTSTSYSDTNLTASITPTSNTSKILVLVSQVCYVSGGGTSENAAKYRVVRDSTNILDYDGEFIKAKDTGGTAELSVNIGISFLDSPATTSSITYKTTGASVTSGRTVVFQQANRPAQIILLEIGA